MTITRLESKSLSVSQFTWRPTAAETRFRELIDERFIDGVRQTLSDQETRRCTQ